jgi:sensor histidine kinase regulating citrate/malate metabolism
MAQLDRIGDLQRAASPAARAELANAWRVKSLRPAIEAAMAQLGWKTFRELISRTPGWPEGLLEVIDRGPGVPPEQQRLIFEKFGRAASPGSPGKPGTGLGLFIARSIAEAHGGALDVLVTGEAGATFRLTLPFPAGGA